MLGGALFFDAGLELYWVERFFDAGFAEFCAGFRWVSQGLICTGWKVFFDTGFAVFCAAFRRV